MKRFPRWTVLLVAPFVLTSMAGPVFGQPVGDVAPLLVPTPVEQAPLPWILPFANYPYIVSPPPAVLESEVVAAFGYQWSAAPARHGASACSPKTTQGLMAVGVTGKPLMAVGSAGRDCDMSVGLSKRS